MSGGGRGGALRGYAVVRRAGILAYAVAHLLGGWLALQLSRGAGAAGGAARAGALHGLAAVEPERQLIQAVGFALLLVAIWQAVELVLGHGRFRGFALWRRRALALVRVVASGALAAYALSLAAGGHPAELPSSGMLAWSQGRVVVALLGLIALGYGIHAITCGIDGEFAEELDLPLPGWLRVLGAATFVAKGLALAVVAGMFVWAAWSTDPTAPRSVDQALAALAATTAGAFLFLVVAAGLLPHGLWCLLWAARPTIAPQNAAMTSEANRSMPVRS